MRGGTECGPGACLDDSTAWQHQQTQQIRETRKFKAVWYEALELKHDPMSESTLSGSTTGQKLEMTLTCVLDALQEDLTV